MSGFIVRNAAFTSTVTMTETTASNAKPPHDFTLPARRKPGSGRPFQDVDPAGLAEPDDVREADPRSVDLPLAALAPQVLADLPYVRDPGGADRMPLGLQATGHV